MAEVPAWSAVVMRRPLSSCQPHRPHRIMGMWRKASVTRTTAWVGTQPATHTMRQEMGRPSSLARAASAVLYSGSSMTTPPSRNSKSRAERSFSASSCFSWRRSKGVLISPKQTKPTCLFMAEFPPISTDLAVFCGGRAAYHVVARTMSVGRRAICCWEALWFFTRLVRTFTAMAIMSS